MKGDPEADPIQLRETAADRLRGILDKYKAATNSELTGKYASPLAINLRPGGEGGVFGHNASFCVV